GGTGQAASPGAQTGPTRLGVDGQAHQGVDEREGLGPTGQCGPRDLGEVGDVRAELRPAGPSAAGGGCDGIGRGRGRVGENGSADRDLTTTAPSDARSKYAASSAP